ncbi:serine/threonine-protein kinase (RIO1) [Vairimorpha necatrix]|uniref:non-specific serine/threonine protein kinase n=1 Tax=Vairimorpha necatrix TaxID=6039 RepID=A0AAX4JC45_9MICR
MTKCKEIKQKKDKSDRNTIDKVLDKKTISILNKLVARKKIIDLQGSIFTGKEANVYLAYASTEIYSKYVKNIHLLDEKNTNKNIFCPKKLQEIIKNTKINKVENEIKNLFIDKNSPLTLSKRKLRKKVKKDKNVIINKEEIKNTEKIIEEKILDKNEPTEEIVKVAIKIYKTSAMNFKDRERYLESEKRFKNFCTKNSRKLIKLWAEKEVRNLKRLNKFNIPSPIPIYLKRNVLIMNLIGSPAPRLRDASFEDPVEVYNQVIQIIFDMYNKCNLIHADLSEWNLLYFENIVYVIDVSQSVERDHINAKEFLITDITNVNNFFTKLGVEVENINDLFTRITDTEIPEYLKNFEITKNTFIPSKLDDVTNFEDVKMFMDSKMSDDDSYSISEEDLESNISEEKNNNEEEMLSKKEKKKIVKEFNKERRAYKISKVEKKRILKKYLGKKKKN